MPHPGEQTTPFCFNVQATPAPVPPFAPSFVTVAVIVCVAFTAMLAGVDEIDTEIARTVICARLNAPVLATEVATTYGPRGRRPRKCGAVLGAV